MPHPCRSHGPSHTCLRHAPCQVVCVAAGFDTRAYRFGAEGVSFYEIDLPHASK